MAEEKKPKIDLKARLGKGGAANVVPATPGMAVPAPVVPPAASSGNAVVPPGVPVGPPPGFSNKPPPSATTLDPSNPLAAAVTPYRAPTQVSAPPPRAQRIEVDEAAVEMARKGARKQGIIAGLVAAGVFAIVGYIAGGATETNRGRQKSVSDAQSLAEDVTKARAQLDALATKVEAGRNALVKEKKFPAELASQLGANIDFDGNKLAGVRFSGFPQETTSSLMEFITSVQSLNDRKAAVANLLTRLQKPITEQLSAGQKTSISYVVLLGKQDPSKNAFGILAPLSTPIEASSPTSIQLPAEFTATDPLTRANVKAPKYTTGNLDKPSALYVLPKSVEAACPSETSGQIAQLGGQLSRLIADVRGEQAVPGGDVITETKSGLIERADKLATSLKTKVQ